jgi:hypothetical protein
MVKGGVSFESCGGVSIGYRPMQPVSSYLLRADLRLKTFHSDLFTGKWQLKKLARIQDPLRIQRVFDSLVQSKIFYRHCVGPPSFFGQPDTVFARDCSGPGDYPAK